MNKLKSLVLGNWIIDLLS